MQRRRSTRLSAVGSSAPSSRASTPSGSRLGAVTKRTPARRPSKQTLKQETVKQEAIAVDDSTDELAVVVPARRTRSTQNLKVPDSEGTSLATSSAGSDAGFADTPATNYSTASSFTNGLKGLTIDLTQGPKRRATRSSLRQSTTTETTSSSKIVLKDEDRMDIDEIADTEDEGLSDDPLDLPPIPLSAKAKGKAKAVDPVSEDEESEFSMNDEEDDFTPSEDEAFAPVKPARGRATKRRKIVVEDSEDDTPLLMSRINSKITKTEMIDALSIGGTSSALSTVPTADSESVYVNEDDDDTSMIAPVPAVTTTTVVRRNRYMTGRRYMHLSRGERARGRLVHMHPIFEQIWKTLEKRPKPIPKQAEQPAGLSLKMMPFQLEGLHWMLEQEKGIYKGGILADEMGMGKTIQTIALLMSEPRKKPNLVVAPTVALMQWKSEIEKHTNNALSVVVFHGSNRPTDIKEVEKYDVCMTTYSVLESVFRKQQSGFKRKDGIVKEASILHKVKFHRVILDEAHNIKDRTCNTAKAVFALKTTYKLCLSGTPLQNRIGEFFSLLRFLEIDPFAYYYCRECPCKELHWKFTDRQHCDSCHHTPMSHVSFFNQEFLKPIQTYGHEGPGKEAMQRLHLLLSHIMLRRTKVERADDLGLPPRLVKIRRDFFNEEELDLYDSIYGSSKRKFDTYVAQGVVLNNYANIFTLITRMRQLADHPDLVLRRRTEGADELPVCVICDEEAEEAIKSRCHHIFCRMCVQSYIDGYSGAGEDATPDCPSCHVPLSIDLSQPSLESLSSQPTSKKNSIVSRIDMSTWRSSTKIEALVEELFKLRSKNHTIKSIVFSQFTNMLQLVEWRLKRAGFKTCMLEGSMSPLQRESVIKYFMENVEVEVFLVSLKAGGVALNLTEASQVFILDPWWNPSVEWQSGDRVHRIGQKRACRITRLVVEDSIESRIVDLQEKKANLIRATVGGDQGAMEKLTAADMQFLFQN